MVLLHGLTGSGASWSPVARGLEGELDVVMPDARGHGRSSAPSDGYRYDELANDVIELVRRLELDHPIVVGHSMGGMTATVVASRAAGLLRGVVLVDPTFLSPERQREVYASDVVEQHRRILALGKAAVAADLAARHPHRSPEIVELLAEARSNTQLVAFDVLAPPNPDYREVVRAIEAPGVARDRRQPGRLARDRRGAPGHQPALAARTDPRRRSRPSVRSARRLANVVASFVRELA